MQNLHLMNVVSNENGINCIRNRIQKKNKSIIYKTVIKPIQNKKDNNVLRCFNKRKIQLSN